MKNVWKEKYTLARANKCGIHTVEGIGVNSWGREKPKWIYYVEVANFRFCFFSIEMIDRYIDFFGRKILPSTRCYGTSPFSMGSSIFVGQGQTPFERLPARLRKKNVRPKIHKKLKEARDYFVENA